jgi:hypothetical protein
MAKKKVATLPGVNPLPYVSSQTLTLLLLLRACFHMKNVLVEWVPYKCIELLTEQLLIGTSGDDQNGAKCHDSAK